MYSFCTTFDGPSDSAFFGYLPRNKYTYSTRHPNSSASQLHVYQFGSLSPLWTFPPGSPSNHNPFQFPESPFDFLETNPTKPRLSIMARSPEDAVRLDNPCSPFLVRIRSCGPGNQAPKDIVHSARSHFNGDQHDERAIYSRICSDDVSG